MIKNDNKKGNKEVCKLFFNWIFGHFEVMFSKEYLKKGSKSIFSFWLIRFPNTSNCAFKFFRKDKVVCMNFIMKMTIKCITTTSGELLFIFLFLGWILWCKWKGVFG